MNPTIPTLGDTPHLVPGLSWHEEPFRRLVESLREYAVILLDPEGRIAAWNEGAKRILGYEADEATGRHFSFLLPRSAVEKGWPQHEIETARRLGSFEDEGWRVRKDGERIWANVVVSAIRDDDGHLLGYSKILRDVTERRAAEERLRESEERTRLLIDDVRDYAIFRLDPAGHIVSWNSGAQSIKGYAPAEILGKHFSVFYPPEARDSGWPDRELEEAARVGRFEDEGWRLRKDGTRFWASVVITALRDRDATLLGFSKITRDLTERRRQEEELRHSEERFRLLLEGIEDYAICMLDPDGRVASWNSGAQAILQYRSHEIVGESFERFHTPEDVAAGRPRELLRDALLNRRTEEHAWRMRKDGTRFWADTVITAMHDAEGRLRGFAAVTRDQSSRKRMEELEEQGRHLTEFLAMLAHELRNPLAPIRNALGIMAATDDPSRLAWCRGVIERQTAQLTRLVDDLLDVSRITRGKLRMQSAVIDINAAVQRALETVRPLIDARRHRLDVRRGAGALRVNGDLARLAQVAINLLTNAAKYTPAGGQIRVDVDAEGNDAVIRVRDNGVGIAPALLDNVFDLFAQGERTLDRAEGGLGIGLTLARRIVQLHGGTITAASDGPGKGAEFVVRLPRLRSEVSQERAPAADDKASSPARKGAVLVVDDNADAAESMAMLLRLAGYEVEVEHDGVAALARATALMPDIVLLDIGLPGMSGYDVARQLRALPQGRAALLFAMTGYGQDADRRRSQESGFDGHLVKPVMPEDLFAMIDGTRRPE
jgi:PAS domain S-box-containing protein